MHGGRGFLQDDKNLFGMNTCSRLYIDYMYIEYFHRDLDKADTHVREAVGKTYIILQELVIKSNLKDE